MKCLAMLACSVVVLAACSDSTAPVEAAGAVAAPSLSATGAPATRDVSSDYQEYSFLAQGPKIVGCTGEPILIEFRSASRLQIVTDASGGMHGTYTVVDKGSTGVGTETGTVFRVREGHAESQNIGGSGYPVVFTAVFTRHFVSPGSAVILMIHNVDHVTMQADGRLTSEVSQRDVTCSR